MSDKLQSSQSWAGSFPVSVTGIVTIEKKEEDKEDKDAKVDSGKT